MKRKSRLPKALWASIIVLHLVAGVAFADSFATTGRYTAQRRPRVTVLDFEDTNQDARDSSYGDSVEAMLVTFLKRKSQFVVVERQKIEPLLKEWKRNRTGLTNLLPTDPTSRQLLERIDAIILGSVTLLPREAQVNTPAGKEEAESESGGTGKEPIRGQRVEIDAKLLSRADGRIIAAAQRSGPVGCLRGIVERLGVAIEQEFLRPYYGSLKFNLRQPENTRVFLTPILLDSALDEEKPPVERSTTVRIGTDIDKVEPWTTDPTTYTIENLLSGWYSMRLERPGYEGLTSTNRWVAREVLGRVQVYDEDAKRQVTSLPQEQKRFVVQVDPLNRKVVEADALGFKFRKLSGSVAPLVKRQYIDDDYIYTPTRVILVGNEELEINRIDRPAEFADDESCDQFEEEVPRMTDLGRTYIAPGEKFELDRFQGGKLVIEDYRGEQVPVGRYKMALWEPSYELHKGKVRVHDRDGTDGEKPTHSVLQREIGSVKVSLTGTREPFKVKLEGNDTRHQESRLLDFTEERTWGSIPVDRYLVATDVPGLAGWQRQLELTGAHSKPPVYDPKKDAELEEKRKEEEKEQKRRGNSRTEEENEKVVEMPLRFPDEPVALTTPPAVVAKTRLTIGGRLSALGWLPSISSKELYFDRTVGDTLDALLRLQPEEQEGKGEDKAAVGRALARILPTVTIQGRVPAVGSVTGTIRPEPSGSPSPTASFLALASNPRLLRERLAAHLEDLDLLVLDDEDMAHLRDMPEVSALIQSFVASGGALLAFVSEGGEYSDIVGETLTVRGRRKKTSRFELAAGDFSGVNFRFQKRKVKVKSRRALADFANLKASDWHVVAYKQGRRDPRIIERGSRRKGGYVALWCDSPSSFRSRRGSRVPDVERARAEVERHVLDWARFLMYRRYDKLGEERRRAEDELAR